MDKYEVDEILNLAIMSKTPYFIVEGIDDICIYEAIARSANINCEIYSVAMIDGYVGGNDGVIQAMTSLDALNMPNGKAVEHYVLGIIDRDARFYRNEMPTLPSIFSLNYYSIESHYISKFAVQPSIDRLTRISSSDEVDVDLIFSKIEQNIFDVFYFSLDALKNAVIPSYQSIISYSSSIGRRKNANTVSALQTIKHDLDLFALNFNISTNIESMREFVKGKWMLTAFAEELFNEIAQLTISCKSSTIKQCRMCELDDTAPCLYQLREGLNKNSLYSMIQDFIEIPDFDYIRSAMKSVEVNAGT